ncbi:hypothetical protein OUZ56_003389 [Daphnia magna]|uniref:Transglutaminase C-terminal domain-containing protein n=1 Tax=Daphnia magna TaxID=35525 RepID=A0ABR0A8Z9_9CRUS|nr:hypothetical protein OUZ56_003389 [Daphnia magna]
MQVKSVADNRVGRLILTKRPGADNDVSDAIVEDITGIYKTLDNTSRNQRLSDGFFNFLFSQGMTSPYLERRDRERERNMIQYPGTSVHQLSAVNITRKPCYDESRYPADSGSFLISELPMKTFNSTWLSKKKLHANSEPFTRNENHHDIPMCRFRLLHRSRCPPYWTQRSLVCPSTGKPRNSATPYELGGIPWQNCRLRAEDDFQLDKPKLDIQVRGNPQIGQECFATFSFMNPVPVTLTECEFTFEGSGLVRAQTVKYHDVKPGEMISFFEKFLPRFSDERKRVATFNSRELGDIVGSRPIHVREEPTFPTIELRNPHDITFCASNLDCP